jgi:phosphatidylserine decarboxylase
MAGRERTPRPARERAAVRLQYALPKRAMTELAGRVADTQRGPATTRLIRWFVRRYGVDMSEAANPDPAAYATFNDFFTRALKAGARPIADADLVCPVDGAISQFGDIEHDQIVQAKGHRYSAVALLGGDAELAARFEHGLFATLYLSPRDYHRIHMPCDGSLLRMTHVPGELFSVNPVTARGVPGLFARNERVVCVFEHVRGPFAVVLVGATIVGGIATVWHGIVNAPRARRPRTWTYAPGQVRLERGQEMGRFLLGSTVVLLFPSSFHAFHPRWVAGGAVRLGEPMGHAIERAISQREPDPLAGDPASAAGDDA